MSPPHVTWATPEKQMGWLDGAGPMTDFAIYAILRDEGNIDNYTEEISNTMKKMSGAFEYAWSILKGTPRRRPKGRGEPERPRKRTASLRTGAQPMDTQSRQARDDKSAFMNPHQMEGMPLGYHYDYGDRKNVEEILFDEYGYGMDDEMAEALLQHSPASANLRQYQYDKRRPEPMYDDEGKVIGDVKDF